MHESSLEWVTDTLLDAFARGETSASATAFLLRRYADTAGDGMREAVEAGLTRGLDELSIEPDPRERCQWLALLAAAAPIADDERLGEAIQKALSRAVDDLERLVREAYEPGEGLIGASLLDQMRVAAALLAAFELTGRLPYPMLAEELIQNARRQAWDEEAGAFRGDFDANSVAVQVLCRLALLHRDPDYMASAVVTEDATYDRDAGRTLNWLSLAYRVHAASAATFGLAVLDCFSLGG
jgi:mannose/cellobiose epimerase-like protein (N-acyl-D-glucosamine 2-epimerase family)